MQAVVLTEVALCGGSGEAFKNGIRIEIRNLKLFLDLVDLITDDLLDNLVFLVLDFVDNVGDTDAFTVRPENSPTTRTRHSASESRRFFIVSSSLR